MAKLRSTYDGRLTYETSYNECKNRNIVGGNVRELVYDIPERNFSTF